MAADRVATIFTLSHRKTMEFGTPGGFGLPYQLKKYGDNQCPVGPRCTLPVDVTFRSKQHPETYQRHTEDVKLGGHAAMFAGQSDAFPKPEDVTITEPVELSGEDGTTLRLIFIFMHSNELGGPPVEILHQLNAKELVSLAQAAQKYLLPNLVAFCQLTLEARVKEMPIEAFAYATKNELSHLAGIAAPYVVAESLKPPPINGNATVQHSVGEVLRKAEIPQAMLLAWFEFRDHYLRLAEAILVVPKPHVNSKDRVHNCGAWDPYTDSILAGLPRTTFALARVVAHRGIADTLDGRWSSLESRELLGDCQLCKKRVDAWEEAVGKALGAMRTFKGLLPQHVLRLGARNSDRGYWIVS